MDIKVKWLIRRDLEMVLEIERDCFPEFAWDEHDFIDVLRRRESIGMVAWVDSTVAGFVVYEISASTLHILNLAVDPWWQRCGVGSAIVRKLVSKLGNGRNRLALEVRETNLPGQLFFRAVGFRAINVLRNAYPDTNESAYLMEMRNSATSCQLCQR